MTAATTSRLRGASPRRGTSPTPGYLSLAGVGPLFTRLETTHTIGEWA
jgi:hypothetical protein